MQARPASIKVRALQWLAQREYSRRELRSKLLYLLSRCAPAGEDAPPPGVDVQLTGVDVQPPGVDAKPPGADAKPPGAGAEAHGAAAPSAAAEVDALLDWLAARGHLSDTRFVESRVNARQSRFGNVRIQQELKQHGLRLAPDAQQVLRQTEEQRAREVWHKKYGQAASDATGRVRQMRFLAGRGFSADVVRRVVLRAGLDAAEGDSGLGGGSNGGSDDGLGGGPD